MLAVGEYGGRRMVLRMMSGMVGGVGLKLQALYGALSRGVLLFGSIHGHTLRKEDDSTCARHTAECREKFIRTFAQ